MRKDHVFLAGTPIIGFADVKAKPFKKDLSLISIAELRTY